MRAYPFVTAAAAAVCLASLATPATASAVYQTGLAAADANTLNQADDDYFEFAVGFDVLGPTTVNQVSFIGGGASAPTAFRISLYLDNGSGFPATAFSQRWTSADYDATSTGVTLSETALTQYSIALSDYELSAGDWYLSIVAEVAGTTPWYWASDNTQGGYAFFRTAGFEQSGFGTFSTSDTFAVTLGEGAPGAQVPLPAALPLLGAGLAALGLLARRRG